jgi:hypothetical protein
MSAVIRIDGTRPWMAAFSRLLIGAALGALALAPLACSSDDECGGVVVAGRCEQTCKPEACPVAGSICWKADNACAAPCPLGNSQCPLGTRCETLQLTETETANHCIIYPFARGGSGKIGQTGEACTTNDQCDVKRGWICDPDKKTCVKPCATHGECDVDRGEYCSGGECLVGGDKKYETCQMTSECAQGAGFACVDGECRLVGCRSHKDCAVIGHCQPGELDLGATVLACVKTSPKPGQSNASCPLATPVTSCKDDGDCSAANQICAKDAEGLGRCAQTCTPEDTSACAASESCIPAADARTVCTECDFGAGFTCLSAGPGDIEGYCTKSSCLADGDCGVGQHCAAVRTSRPPCQDACGFTGQPSAANCVQPGAIGAGKEYACGPLTLLRNICLKRDFCNECETDTDCLGLPDQICSKDSGGRKICTEICDSATNSCPWGNAAQCGDWDGDGVFTCSHRYPTGCVGEGKSCHPCIDDLDCPGGLCLQSDFTLERYCVDLAPECTCHPCSTDTDCPNGQCEGRCEFGGAVCVGDDQCAPKTCVSGKCQGTSKTCTDDPDCANVCKKGNHYCKGITVDQNVLCRGTAALPTGCPKTPGGLEMNCYGGNDLKASGNALYKKCVGANVNTNPLATPQGGCWPKP